MPTSRIAASKRRELDQLQRDEFLATGVLHLPGVIPKPAIDAMANRLWEALARRHGIVRGRPETWRKERPGQFGDLRRSGAFAGMASPGLVALLDDVFGQASWRPPAHWGQALVTFPTGTRSWNVPGVAWHLDILPGQILQPWPEYVRIFTFLAPLEPGGGGTAYVSGSHRVALEIMSNMSRREAVRSASVREALKEESPWIAALCSQADDARRMKGLMEDGTTVRGVDLRVGEMSGEPGDVVLMHPATLHAPSPNCRSTPRLMLAESIYAKQPLLGRRS